MPPYGFGDENAPWPSLAILNSSGYTAQGPGSREWYLDAGVRREAEYDGTAWVPVSTGAVNYATQSAATAAGLAAIAAGGSPAPFASWGSGAGLVVGAWDPTLDGGVGAYGPVASIGDPINLFDKSGVTLDTFIGANGTASSSASYSVSGYIPVVVGKTYSMEVALGEISSGARFVTAYNSAYVVVPASGSNVEIASYTVPEGVAYIRVTINKTKADVFQVKEASGRTHYVGYGAMVRGIPITGTLSQNAWKNKKLSVLSDSIGNTGWPAIICAKLEMVLDLHYAGGTWISGPNGSTTAMCQDARLATIAADHDAAIICGGINDWANNVALGSGIDETDPETFYGALNTLCSKYFTANPTKRLIFQTTSYGELYNYKPRGWDNAHQNTLGLTTRDYAQCIRVIAQKWGVPVVDISAESGWNTVNIRTYIKDDGGLLHPNATGAARMATIYTGRLLALQPNA